MAQARALAPIVELHEASRIPIVEFYSGFVVGELQECMGIIRMNPPSAYLMAKGSRLEKLEAMSKLDLTKEESDNGIGNNQGYNLALFPNQKKNIINGLMAKFDEEHSESVLAADLEREGAAKIIIQRMSENVGAVEKERSGWRVSNTGVVAKGTAEAEPALEVDDVVGALRMYQTFVKDEVAACDDDHSINNIIILQKVLINELTLALSSRALDAANGHGINLDKIFVTLIKDKADNTCIEGIFKNTNSTDATRFYLWARVVSASVDANLNRQVVIRLGSSHGIDLFLDGSGTSATAALTFASDGMSSPLGRARSK